MATILLTYEFGSGLGHVNRLIAVARRLDPSHRLVFALPNPEISRMSIASTFEGRAIVRSGVHWGAPIDPRARTLPTKTFADVLQLFGYGNIAVIGPAAEQWRRVVDDVGPDLIISDFAPTLRVAVGKAVPIIVVGNGYTVPPRGQMLQPMRPWETNVPATSRANEASLLEAVNRLRARAGSDAIDYLSDAFSGDNTYVCTLSEFDPYAPSRIDPVTFPFNVSNMSAGPSVSTRSGPTIFVYLPAFHPGLPVVLAVLDHLGHESQIYLSESGHRKDGYLSKGNLLFLSSPAEFSQILPQVCLLIHHAGLGTAYAGLASGTPQLVLPMNLEHLITGRALVSSGVAEGFNKFPLNEIQLERSINNLLRNGSFRERAMARAIDLPRNSDPLAEIVASCERRVAHG